MKQVQTGKSHNMQNETEIAEEINQQFDDNTIYSIKNQGLKAKLLIITTQIFGSAR